jgi:hypothetical protein
MIVSITGIPNDGTEEISFHINPDALSDALHKALEKARNTGVIAVALLKEMEKQKIWWQSMIDEQLEFDIKS